MRKADTIASIIGGVVLMGVLLPISQQLGAYLDDRSVSIFRKCPSPDGKFKVVVYDVLGNATVGANTDVALVESSETLESTERGLPAWMDHSWKFFTADSDHGKAPCLQSGACPPVKVTWLSGNEVKLTYPQGSRIFLQLRQGNLAGHPFTIEYSEEAKPN